MKEIITDKRVSKNLQPAEVAIEKIAEQFKQILYILGLDADDESISDTPKRVAKMYVNEIFSGLRDPFPKITTFPNDENYDQILLERNITLTSTCEHHFVTFEGFAHIAYLPGTRVIGLSKFSRIVQYFSSRPQLQERLTQQIGKCLSEILETEDVAVVIQAKHLCCSTRGAKDPNCSTTTSYMSGIFRNNMEVRSEFFSLLGFKL